LCSSTLPSSLPFVILNIFNIFTILVIVIVLVNFILFVTIAFTTTCTEAKPTPRPRG